MNFFKSFLVLFGLILVINSVYSFDANSSNYSLTMNFGSIQTQANSSNYYTSINGFTKVSGIGQAVVVTPPSSSSSTSNSSSSSSSSGGGSGVVSSSTYIPKTNSAISTNLVKKVNNSNKISISKTKFNSSIKTIELTKVLNKTLIGLKPKTKEKFEILIDNKIKTSSSYSGKKLVQLKNKKTNKKVVEFNFDFKNNLDLSKLEIKSQNLSKNNYVIVSGLELKNLTKTIKLGIIDNTSTICIKDADLNSITQISKNCDKLNEYVINCNDKLTSNNYSCKIENNQYIISGLKHSGVLEVDKSLLKTSVKTNNNSNLTYYLLSGFIIIILIIFFIMRKNKSDYHSKNNISNDDPYYLNAKKYVQSYKTQYTKEQLYTALKEQNYSEDILEKVFKEEY